MNDGLPAHCPPRLIRGDVSYGSEEGMTEAEARRQLYLFKPRQTTKVQKQLRELERDGQAWTDAGDGWQGAERELKLMGWSRARRSGAPATAIVTRRGNFTSQPQEQFGRAQRG
ncbi:MAG: hypothetical protein FJ276_32435 [Planctomycetes bacterium]|nr:hypothetical protein [Planctomycetota bacterium]